MDGSTRESSSILPLVRLALVLSLIFSTLHPTCCTCALLHSYLEMLMDGCTRHLSATRPTFPSLGSPLLHGPRTLRPQIVGHPSDHGAVRHRIPSRIEGGSSRGVHVVALRFVSGGKGGMTDAPWNEMESDPFPRRRSPWVLVGAMATAGVLVTGLVAFRKGNAALSQSMMRARILVQGGTVAVMVATSGGMMFAKQKSKAPVEE